jgi:hypothetical protein
MVDRDGRDRHAGIEGVSVSIGWFPAEGTEFESRVHGVIASPASMIRIGIQDLATAIACQHGHTLFDPQKRNKKQAEIMINALVVSCLQTAAGANFGVFIEYLGFRLNACDQKHVNVAYGNELIFFMKQMDMSRVTTLYASHFQGITLERARLTNHLPDAQVKEM